MSSFSIPNIKGYGAILIWSFSAVFIAWTPLMPPMGLVMVSSIIGFLGFAVKWILERRPLRDIFARHWQIWLLFFLALPVYRGLYYAGLKMAPIVEANLINYLWPLLIVVVIRIFHQQKPGLYTIFGTLSCFLGMVFIGLGKSDGQLFLSFEWGHLLAFIAAVVWAIYSAFTGKGQKSMIDMIGVMLVVSAVIFAFAHFNFEPAIDFAALDHWHWIGIFGLGFSVALASLFWDEAMTGGDRTHVSVVAYSTPLLSTLWLILFSDAQMSAYTYAACAFIIFGITLPRFSPKNKAI